MLTLAAEAARAQAGRTGRALTRCPRPLRGPPNAWATSNAALKADQVFFTGIDKIFFTHRSSAGPVSITAF